MEGANDGISTILMTVTSTAGGVDNLQGRLNAALDDLEKPLVRITDEVSDLHNALKGTSHTTHRLS